MTTKFPNIPGTYHLLNDGNIRVEAVAAGAKVVVLGVTTADIEINTPISLQQLSSKISISHPGKGDLPIIPSEINRGIAEVGKNVIVEFMKIAHGWGEEGYLHLAHADFDGHIVTETERYAALEQSLDLLLNYDADVVYIPGIYADKKADISSIYLADGVTQKYAVGLGDFAYQLADFCDDSNAENQSVISGIGRMPKRIDQFYEGCAADYFNLLGYAQVDVLSVTSSTGVVVLSAAFGDNAPFKGSSILINYPTGPRTYTVASDNGVDELTLKEDNPLEFTAVVAPSSSSSISSSSATISSLTATMQYFDTSGADVYDQALTDKIQAAYRRAFQGLHPTDTTLTSSTLSLYEFQEYLNDALAFTNMLELDGTTAQASDLLPTNYRMWKQTGGAPLNPNGADGDLVDGVGNRIDLGKWLSLGSLNGKSSNSFGDQSFNLIGISTGRAYISNGIGEYLSLAMKLASQSATTNKVIQGFSSDRDIKKSTLDKLIGSRYIVTSKSPSKGFVVAAGNTAAYFIDNNRRSDFVFLSSIRITIDLLQQAREIVDPYLGEAMNATAFSALETDLAVMYREAVLAGKIYAGFEFSLTQTPDQRVLGHASLNQTIRPAYEFRKLFTETNLTK